MATLKNYNLKGAEAGTVNIDEALLDIHVHLKCIKDYIIAIRHNARQWSAHTQRRGEKMATGAKPHPQKGGGRSRQGSVVVAHYRGGAVTWGPQAKEKDTHTRINMKERRLAIRFLLAEKIKGERVIVLENGKVEKTKAMAKCLDAIIVKAPHHETKEEMQVPLIDRRVLVIGNGEADENFYKCLRNIPKKEYLPLNQVNGYEVLRAQEIVVLKNAVEDLKNLLG